MCSTVWSLGEGQPVEELEKQLENTQLSTLLIEQPQSGSISVGESTDSSSAGWNLTKGKSWKVLESVKPGRIYLWMFILENSFVDGYLLGGKAFCAVITSKQKNKVYLL